AGTTGTDSGLVTALFPGRRVISIALDRSPPLLEPPGAWECLDAVALDDSDAGRLSDHQIGALLGGGTTIAIRSASRPRGQWPWEKQGEFWILRWKVAGPQSLLSEAAYLPIASWDAGWPVAFRRGVLLCTLLFSIVALGM